MDQYDQDYEHEVGQNYRKLSKIIVQDDLQARSGPDSPKAKAVKYAKVLRKIKSEYLGDCKKLQKINDRINR